MSVLALNGLPCVAVYLSIPAVGPWTANLDLDLPEPFVVPSGRNVLTIGKATLVGTVDPRGSGRFGTKATIALVAGANGWDKDVPALQLHNDAGVTTTAVFTATAAAVGETVVDGSPRILGVDYARCAGPASRVLAGAGWYVDAAGVTRVAPRPPVPLPGGADVLTWDAGSRAATIAFDGILWPGTILVDSRFGSAVVRDVSTRFDANGARSLAWCETGPAIAHETAGNRLARGVGALAKAAIGAEHLRCYRYRVVLQGPDGRLTLQAVTRADGAPDLIAVPVWPGVAGASHELAPATGVLVAFIAGDPARPVVVGFDPLSPPPIKTVLATGRLEVGGGTSPAVLATAEFIAWVEAVSAAIPVNAPTVYQSTNFFAEP